MNERSCKKLNIAARKYIDTLTARPARVKSQEEADLQAEKMAGEFMKIQAVYSATFKQYMADGGSAHTMSEMCYKRVKRITKLVKNLLGEIK